MHLGYQVLFDRCVCVCVCGCVSPVEVLAQFDALLGLQVAQAAQQARGRVKGHLQELRQGKSSTGSDFMSRDTTAEKCTRHFTSFNSTF